MLALAQLPPIKALASMLMDFRSIFERDPAARNCLEVMLCYPGLQVRVRVACPSP